MSASKSREDLHQLLVDILGSNNVYFQPPESFKLKYPCIVYERSDIRTYKADGIKYTVQKRYTVTYISEDPDSEIPDVLIQLPYCSFDRHFKSGNMNHDVFDLYY